MNESNPPVRPPEPADAPFGSGVPVEPVEPVRLRPGLAHGPALDVRGGVAPQPVQPPFGAQSPVPQQPAGQNSGSIPPATTYVPSRSPAYPGSAHPSAASASPSTPEQSVGGSTPGAAPVPPSYAGAHSAPPYTSPGAPTSPPPGSPPASSAAPALAKPKGRGWIAFAHLLFLVPSVPIPFGIAATALVWIWRREKDPLMADQGREALNMQLTYWLAIGVLGIAGCIAHVLIPFVYVLGAILCVLAAISASGGERHRYPRIFRFLT